MNTQLISASRLRIPTLRLAVAFLGLVALPAFSLQGNLANGQPTAKPAPTFAKDIAPIVFEQCTPCHRPGDIGPFPLLGYQDAEKRAKQIAQVVKSGYMPPWKADSHGEFKGERRLTEAQRNVIQQWAENDAPLGNPQELPPTPPAPPSGWRLGAPDLVVKMQQPYQVAAEGDDVYRCFVIPNPTSEPVYLSAVDFKPGSRATVHHVNLFLDTTGMAEKLDSLSEAPGFNSGGGGPGFPPTAILGGWVPGRTTGMLPEGVGVYLPKGGVLVMEIHYHKTGKPEIDQTTAALYFCKKPVDKRLRVLSAMNLGLRIPAGKAKHIVEYGTTIQQDITLLDVTPHMHWLGKEMTVNVLPPDGKERQLIHVPDWDYRWQTVYEFVEPIKLPRGSQISVRARYDNSTGNPRNPHNPPKEITWGEAASDEMCTAFIGFTVDAEHLTKGKKVGRIHPYEAPDPTGS
jgi:hypothetical protein